MSEAWTTFKWLVLVSSLFSVALILVRCVVAVRRAEADLAQEEQSIYSGGRLR